MTSEKLITKLLALACIYLMSTPVLGADYYWVGGSGNWADITHWATMSGGNTQHNAVPSSLDNVYFDANSFSAPNQIVTVNNQNVFCASMNWTGAAGNPRLVGPPENAINIGGDFILTPNMLLNVRGIIRLSGDANGNINTFGKTILGVLEINGGANSNWTLVGDLTIDSLLKINSGGLSTNGSDITTKQMHVYAISETNLDLSSSMIRITGSIRIQERNYYNIFPTFGILTNNLTLNEGTSTIQFTSRFPSVRIFGTKNIKFNNLDFTSPSGLSLFNYLRQFRWDFENFFDWDNRPLISSNRLLFNSNAFVFNNHMTKELSLSPAKSYRFENNRTFIIQQLTALGQCSAPITINTTNPIGQATFQFSGNQTGEYINIRNIHAQGTGSFVINNSSNLGNNNGWTLNERTGNTLFWVGGKGRWSDAMHWSTMSGGVGGGCVPSPSDDVVFDQNSFSGNDSVILDVDDALCKSMTWENITSAPIFSSTELQSLNIFGSLKLHPQVNLNLEGDVYFLSSENVTIDMAEKEFLKDVYFIGKGQWDFESDFGTRYFVYFNSGHIKTNSFQFSFESLLSEVDDARKLTLGSSIINIRTKRDYLPYLRFSINTISFELDAGSSTVNFTSTGGLSNWGEYNVVNEMQWNKINFFGGGSLESSRADFKARKVAFYSTGDLRANLDIDHLYLEPGYSYRFIEYDPEIEQIFVDTLDANGRCDANIVISSEWKDHQSRIFSSHNQIGSNLIIEDVSFNGATFTASQSIDHGNTTGWIIDNITGRDLYWVEGTGSWNEPAHWSLASGGAGGECVPTSLDNVYFDENSFSDPNQVVTSQSFNVATCRNFVWDGPPESIRFSRHDDAGGCCGGFYIYGSFDVRTPFNSEVYDIEFRGNELEHIIRTSGIMINNYYFRGSGNRTLMDPFSANFVRMSSGGLKTNNHRVECGTWQIWSEYSNFHLDLDTSTIVLWDEGHSFWGTLGLIADNNFSFDAGQSEIIFTNSNRANLSWQGTHAFHNILFSASTGTGYLNRIGNNEDKNGNVKINKLQFNSDGIVYGDHTLDTLLFANGRSYTLESQKTQEVIDHLQIRGNNCIQLQLKSTQPGVRSIIVKKNGTVDGDFIQMQDQIARGGATFFAGANSADISNNQGWVFEPAEEFVEFGLLGDDVVFCNGETSLTINEEDLVGAISYQWSDGSSDPALIVDNPGVYWLAADYANNCTLIDTIYILEADDFQVDLGPDQTLCQGEELDLNGDLNLNGANYVWNDGSSGPQRILNQSGQYKLTAELNGCFHSDSLLLAYVEIPEFDLSATGEVCQGDTVVLDVPIGGVSVLWSTGSTNPILEVTESNTYWLTVAKDGCEDSDTLDLNFIAPAIFELGNDTILCAGQELLIDYINPQESAEYLWNDGSNLLDRSLSSTGTFVLTSQVSVCPFIDSIYVEVIEIPELNLGADEQVCEGETISLDATIPDAMIMWSTGSSNPQIDLTQSGEYWLSIAKEGCEVVDTFVLDFTPLPQFDLGGPPEICAGESVTLNASTQGASYLWSNGATTEQINPIPISTQIFGVQVAFGRCFTEDSISVTVKPLPEISIGNDLDFCPGDSFVLSVVTNGDNIMWIDGNSDLERTLSEPGLYEVSSLLNGCLNNTSIQSTFFDIAFIGLGPDTLICDDTVYPIDITILNGSYSWSDGSTDGVLNIDKEGIYAVEVFDGNCYFQDDVEITTRECIYFDLYAPNIFSPNEDGINDEFTLGIDPRIQINDFKMQIFNRWGSLLYQSADITNGWNGKLKDLVLGNEVYIYRIEIEYLDDNGPGKYKGGGDIMLMR